MRPGKLILLSVLVASLIGAFFFGGCRREDNRPLHKIRVGYVGITCEAPIFTAVEKGFFKEEGLEVELVKCDWKNYKDVLALGGYDITHHLVMYFLKPLEQGLDIKFTGGIHRGCLRLQTTVNSPIKTVQDLKGKKIGVPGMGTPPFIFAYRVLGTKGLDASRDVSWLVYPAAELGLALEKGEVDAIADSEPIGSMLVASGKVRNIADQATDYPYSEEYCCAVLANGAFIKRNPKATAGATRALLKAAKWVETNPAAAAKLSVEGKYLASTVDQNTFAISHLRYVPSVLGARRAVELAAGEMQTAGMLRSDTDLAELTRRAFISLDGVTDEWLRTLEVEKVAGGQVTKRWMWQQYAKYQNHPNPADVFCGLCINPVN